MVAKKGKRAVEAARLFKLVSSPTRAGILFTIIGKKSISVGDIAKEVRMTHSAVSHQLGLLSRSGIVASAKSGRLVHYALGKTPEAKALARFLSTF